LPPADPQEVEAPQEGAGEYPSLSSVPDEPPRRPSGRQERQEIRDSLSADRSNARYSDQEQTGEGIEARQRAGAAADTGPTDAPERPQVAQQMPADDAGASNRRAGSQTTDTPTSGTGNAADDGSQTAASGSGRSESGRSESGRSDSGRGERTARSTDAADVPQLQQSEQGEPIEVPGQPTFRGADSSAAATSGQTRRAQQQQSASRQADTRASGSAPEPQVGQSRTLSRQDAGGQTMADGGRRIAVIYFRHGASSLQGRDRKVLRDVAQIYERQGRDLRVVGHASSRTAAMDPVDHRMANFDTSLKRAQAVVDALVSMGVPRDAIQLEARGDNEPVYHEFMPTGEAGNRRAEVFLQG
jgi:outer membrane protein OmpA-like peptidoglycan-associated protein